MNDKVFQELKKFKNNPKDFTKLFPSKKSQVNYFEKLLKDYQLFYSNILIALSYSQQIEQEEDYIKFATSYMLKLFNPLNIPYNE